MMSEAVMDALSAVLVLILVFGSIAAVIYFYDQWRHR